MEWVTAAAHALPAIPAGGPSLFVSGRFHGLRRFPRQRHTLPLPPYLRILRAAAGLLALFAHAMTAVHALP